LSTAAAMIIISGIKDTRKIAITAFISSSLGVVISVLMNNE
jgi:hypothetical protein